MLDRRNTMFRACYLVALVVLVLLVSLLLLVQHHLNVTASAAGQNPQVKRDSSTSSTSSTVFVRTSGIRFVKNNGDEPFYFNGFNAYWLMLMGSNPVGRGNVTLAFQQANKYGMTVMRTWAFSDGTTTPLQSSPGIYNEEMFKGLDFVISEAGKYGIKVILSLVNNYPDFGGRKQYVQWARDQGAQQLTSDDDFYTNPVVKGYYKNHVKAVLGRENTITRVAYKDDPTIFAWELMNEPRCETDLSGTTLQEWIKEMGGHVKSIDRNHLVEVGLEGFYGESNKQYNPHSFLFGTDFITNNQISEIDFATIHAYPDIWFPGSEQQAQLDFVREWLQVHIQDSSEVLKKPLIFSEFGKSTKDTGYNISQRDSYFSSLYDQIYESAISGGPCNGGLFWQILNDQGMDGLRDGYEVILEESPSTANIIAQQSTKLAQIR